METEIRIEAEMTDEQLDCLLSEIKNTAEIIGINLKVESIKLHQHTVSESVCLNCYDVQGFLEGMTCFKCGKDLSKPN